MQTQTTSAGLPASAAAPIIAARKPASVKALCQLKDVTPELAEEIRHAWRTIPNRREAREAVDCLFRSCGVEHLGVHKRSHFDVYYCNAGDTYAPTILFIGVRMVVGTWGDLVERRAIHENVHQSW